ncbi:MAG: hypothetical protein ABL996_11740, partial [Micropepsaceae bacterium]
MGRSVSGRLLLLGLALTLCAQVASAQQEEEPPPISFSPPSLEPPSRDESGPLDRKLPERRKIDSQLLNAEPILVDTKIGGAAAPAPAAATSAPATPAAATAAPVAAEPAPAPEPAPEPAGEQRLR